MCNQNNKGCLKQFLLNRDTPYCPFYTAYLPALRGCCAKCGNGVKCLHLCVGIWVQPWGWHWALSSSCGCVLQELCPHRDSTSCVLCSSYHKDLPGECGGLNKTTTRIMGEHHSASDCALNWTSHCHPLLCIDHSEMCQLEVRLNRHGVWFLSVARIIILPNNQLS